MRTIAVLILSIMMCAFMQQAMANGSISEKLRNGVPVELSSEEVGFQIKECVETVWELVKWGYLMFQAVRASEISVIIALVSQVTIIGSNLYSYCL